MDQSPIVEQMARPDFYPHRPQKVEAVQTHISYVFIAGDYVYKVKKPVNFGFLDFTTLEKRKFYCEEELRLNRRLAPSIYLDVVPIGRDDAGRLTLGKTTNLVEYAVLMNKLPLDKMLKILLARGKADAGVMDAVAKKIARFSLSSWPRAIVHIDGDAFFTSCEEAIHPELRGKALITGGERGIVACASYPAKKLGIKRGVPLAEARKICPGLIVLPSDYET
ncbi:MAG: hypothetical protein WBI25_10875 [Smithellaceae bacterium]